MSNDEQIIFYGIVDDILPSTKFKVTLTHNEDGDPMAAHTIIAYLGGKLRKNNIKVLAGDEVKVEMSPYDLTQGRIVYRTK